MNSENSLSVVVQAVVAVAVIAGAVFLAYLDPTQRPLLGGALILGIGSATGFFFSQRATTAGTHSATNGMSTMAQLVASSTPGPTGETGPPGPPGAAAPASAWHPAAPTPPAPGVTP